MFKLFVYTVCLTSPIYRHNKELLQIIVCGVARYVNSHKLKIFFIIPVASIFLDRFEFTLPLKLSAKVWICLEHRFWRIIDRQCPKKMERESLSQCWFAWNHHALGVLNKTHFLPKNCPIQREGLIQFYTRC